MFGFGKKEDGEKCPLCEGKGTMGKGYRYELVLCHDSPSKLKTAEQAVVLVLSAVTGSIADSLKLDATQIEVHVEFKGTKSKQGFRLRLPQK